MQYTDCTDYLHAEFFSDIYANDPADFEFSGTVAMHLTCFAATNVIFFHTRSMTIDENALVVRDAGSSTEYSITGITRDDVTEQYRVELVETLDIDDQVIVDVSYTGPITNDMSGMYYSYYYDIGSDSTK